MPHFHEIETNSIHHKTIFVDIDGTLLAEGEDQPTWSVLQKLETLGKNNSVYLCSNALKHARGKELAQKTNVYYIESTHKKPSKKLLSAVEQKSAGMLVIGDKILTDGLFAYRINAQFIKVSRYRPPNHRNEPVSARVAYILDDISSLLYGIVRMVRPRQQLKNILVLAPLFFAQRAFYIDDVISAVLATGVFCLLAGAVYIGNDIVDVENDRKHPTKRNRPLAAHLIQAPVATLTALLLAIGGLALSAYYVPSATPFFFAYILLNIFYSLHLKEIPIVDILVVSIFYVIRILVGGIAVNVPISSWLILTTIFLSLFLVIGKRVSEVRGSRVRTVTNSYTDTFLNNLLNITATATLISYGIYTVLHSENQIMMYSIFPVIMGMFRYLYILDSGTSGESPERVLFKDKMIQLSIVCWLLIIAFIFY